MQSVRQWRRIHEYCGAGNVEAARIACLSLLHSVPGDVEGWRMLSTLETRRGAYRAAHAAIVEAARQSLAQRVNPQLAHLTHALLAFDEPALVRSLVEESDWNSAEVARQAPVLAQHLSLSGHDAEALRFCNHMRRRIHPDPRLEYIAGLAARNTGDGDEAEAAFERAIALDSGFSQAHWSLACHRPRGGTRIARIRAVLQEVPSFSDEAIDLQYALYRECEVAGELEDAWYFLESAATTKKARLGERTAPYTGDAKMSVGELPHSNAAPIVFIVGLPRSGTTVLERMLGNHPDVRAGGELNAFHAALCEASNRFLPLPSMSNALPALDEPARVGMLYRQAAQRLCTPGQVLVDKNPSNFVYAASIAEALPEARILCLRRAPMDACFSNLKELFPGDAYPYSYSVEALAAQYTWFDSMRSAFEVALPDRFLTVPYESMVADTAAMSHRVLEFCGLRHVDGCEHIERNTAPVSTASATQVREPVHGRGVGAWRAYERQLEPMQNALRALGTNA